MLAAALLALLAGCDEGGSDVGEERLLVEGDLGSARQIIAREGCGACHVIPGIPGARGRVGPPLRGLAGRGYIAGFLPNRAPNLIRWIRAAPDLDPGTAMPGFDLTEREARDIAAYLYRTE
jgi:mono/diheme cytochrome c family protein